MLACICGGIGEALAGICVACAMGLAVLWRKWRRA